MLLPLLCTLESKGYAHGAPQVEGIKRGESGGTVGEGGLGGSAVDRRRRLVFTG